MSATHRRSVILAAVLLTAAAAVTAYFMLNPAEWRIDLALGLFIFWAISPYVCFFAAGRLLIRLSPASKIGIPIVLIASLMLAFTLYAYVGTSGDPSSTYALIFVFVPLYLYVGSFFMLSLTILISRIFMKKI